MSARHTLFSVIALLASAVLAEELPASSDVQRDSVFHLSGPECLNGSFFGIALRAPFSPDSVTRVISEKAVPDTPGVFLVIEPKASQTAGLVYTVAVDKPTSKIVIADLLIRTSDTSLKEAQIASLREEYKIAGFSSERAGSFAHYDKATKIMVNATKEERGVRLMCVLDPFDWLTKPK